MKTDFWRVLVLAATFCAARLVFLGLSGAPPEAAYFFLCGEHPAPAYYDGPAGTALLVRAASNLGGDWWLALGPLAALTASLMLWRLAVRLFDPRSAFWGVVALNCLPVFNAEAFVPGPLLPALAFFLAGATSVWEASRRQSGGLPGWMAAGAAFAGACLFSWWSVPFIAAALLAPFSARIARRPGNIFGATLAGLIPLMALTPSWLWLDAHQWISFSGGTPRLLFEFQPRSLGRGVVGLLVGLSPLLAPTLAVAFFSISKKAKNSAAANFAVFLALPGIILGALAVYRGWEAAQWALPAAALLMAPACGLLSRPLLAAALALAVALSLPVWMAVPRVASGARTAADILLALDEKLSPDLDGGLFLIASDPLLASALGYHLREAFIAPPGQPRVFVAASQDQSGQFSLWKSYDQFEETNEPPDEYFTEVRATNPFLGHAALYVGPESPDQLPTKIRSAFSEVQLVRETGNGEDRLHIYLCLDYQSLPL